MKYLDFIFQTLVFAIVILALGNDLINGLRFNDSLMVTACAAIILGAWQMGSSFISIIAKSGLYKLKRLHFIIATVYLLILCFLNLSPTLGDNYVSFICMCTPPVGLAIFYYYITCRWVFIPKPTSRFLAHINF